ncbi:MAG TPA: hypothetical protein VH761_11825 [Ilumatobacteraceae bacterium]
MDASTPNSPSSPVWGPPRDPLIARGPVPGSGPQKSPRRRHPAARARQVAGWAAVASSAALVGFMVTANADDNASQSGSPQPVVVTPTSPPQSVVVPTTQPTAQPTGESDDDDETEQTPATVPATPATLPTLPTVATPAPTRTQPAQPPSQPTHGGPISSTHGS